MASPTELFADITDPRELIGVAVGAGSVCWSTLTYAGEFQPDRAAEIVEAAHQRLQAILADQFVLADVDQVKYCIRAQLDQAFIDMPCGSMEDADRIAEQVTRALEREGKLR